MIALAAVGCKRLLASLVRLTKLSLERVETFTVAGLIGLTERPAHHDCPCESGIVVRQLFDFRKVGLEMHLEEMLKKAAGNRV
jgi:hypothetical protein